MALVSVVIPSLERPEALERCLRSLREQTFRDYELLIEGERGELARIRNQGWRRASGEYVIFIDDDVWCPPQWLAHHVDTLQRNRHVVGASGPAIITGEYRAQRDLFKWPLIKRWYDWVFLEGKHGLPGHITKAGTWTTGAADERGWYAGPVDFAEACNMAFRKDLLEKIGGFDEGYRGIGDWSEPDLSFRARRHGLIWYNPKAMLYHEPSRTGAYLARAQAAERWSNYLRFSGRWIHPHWKHTAYKAFLWSYLWLKQRRLI